MATGLDPKAFRTRFVSASPDERRKLLSSYRAWVNEGAKAQRWSGRIGGVIAAGFLSLLVTLFLDRMASAPLCALCVLGAGLGVWQFWNGAKKETAWRRDHPFMDEDVV
jgi:hypothetical protein